MRSVFLAPALACALTACGGADFEDHNGYPASVSKPWRKATVLTFDPRGEVEVDHAVSYPRRERARWFAVDLPASGKLEVELIASPSAETQSGPGLAFEVLDASYRVVAKADREDDDSGEDDKKRVVENAVPGRYRIHVYAQRRNDEADFTLRVVYRSALVQSASGFPGTVDFVTVLPEVPAIDDTPRPKPKVVARPVKKPAPKAKPKPAPSPVLKARIAGITTSGSRTTLKIDRGSQDGIAVGWIGEVITSDGASIPGGKFEVTRVSQQESFGSVRASPEAVTAARFVRLRRN